MSDLIETLQAYINCLVDKGMKLLSRTEIRMVKIKINGSFLNIGRVLSIGVCVCGKRGYSNK